MILLLHFLAGAFGALLLFLIFTCVLRREGFSLPTVAIFIGLLCAIFAHFLSGWATPAVLLIYAMGLWREWREECSQRSHQ
jgi:hypothetical protein